MRALLSFAATTTMAVLIAVFDLSWCLLLATAVARVQRGYRERFQRWTERITGGVGVLVTLGVRMAVECR
jgi:threonine/homoserine/homoserine lactone efflux protein